ncbi:phosphotransferase family protein [Spiroplasma endosymbiont of Diplazon laetatorius]|uniref:phosphotransferase family protein n=1 Tax=Spiroplasma endosymbiont of Diplazon laetatorius TaxID=3066322 RepID=UPI0030D2E567
MKFKGYTNKITLKKDILVKESISFHDIYLDKKNEYLFLEELVDIKTDCLLKPEKFYWDNNNLISEYKYLKDFKTLEELELNKEIIDNLVINLKQIKEIDISNSKVKTFEYINFLNIFKENIKQDISIYEEYIEEIKQYALYFETLDLTLSHNDLVPGNILFKDNKVILIDYDYVTLNNKFFDLASFITETLNNKEDLIDYFISKSIESELLKENELNTLNKMIKYQDLLWSLWAIFMYENKKEKVFLNIYEEKINRLKNRKIY